MLDMLQSIDVGLIVIDTDLQIRTWNSFMENHSGLQSQQVVGQEILDLYQDIPRSWFKRKIESVVMLKSRAFTSWEQRPFLFKFKNSRPITGSVEFMYQNITFIPLISKGNEVEHIGIIVSDVTDVAVNKGLLESANAQLEALSRIDGLTLLFNRRYWEECLSREFVRSQRTHQHHTLVMCDIDHFKEINDSHGHPAGDEIIRNTAGIIRDTIRTIDFAGRYGGEEFGVILIDTSVTDAFIVAERLRKRIESNIVNYVGQPISYRLSLGIAGTDENMDSHKDWIAAADQALYESKNAGRNRTTIYRNHRPIN